MPFAQGSSIPAALTGSVATNTILGPFRPAMGVAVYCELTFAAGGTARVTRSSDGGTTKFPLMVLNTELGGPFTTSGVREVWIENGTSDLYLDLQPSGGAISYRLGH